MRQHFSWWCAISAVILLPLVQGGFSLLADSLFTVLAGTALLFSPHGKSRNHWARLAQLAWLLWIAWQVMQLAPLPQAALAVIAPGSNAAWLNNAELIPSLSPRISLFPVESVRFLIASLGLWCLWETMRSLHASRPRLARNTLVAFTCAGLLQAFYGTVSHLGIWSIPWLEPTGHVHVDVAHGTFANRNHYAAYLILCTAATLALMMAPANAAGVFLRGSVRRLLDFITSATPVYRTILFIMVVAIVLTQSRMGNTALGVGLGAFAFAWILQTRDMRSFLIALSIFASILVVDVLIISERFGLEKVVQRIEQTDIDTDARVTAREIGDRMLEAYLPSGSGLGSFPRLEPLHDLRFGGAPFAFAHNDHQQLLIEAGIPGYAILCLLVLSHAALAIRLLKSRRNLHRSIGAAILMIISAAVLHSSVEFLAYTPGWRALFIALLGMMAGLPAPRRGTPLISMHWDGRNPR